MHLLSFCCSLCMFCDWQQWWCYLCGQFVLLTTIVCTSIEHVICRDRVKQLVMYFWVFPFLCYILSFCRRRRWWWCWTSSTTECSRVITLLSSHSDFEITDLWISLFWFLPLDISVVRYIVLCLFNDWRLFGVGTIHFVLCVGMLHPWHWTFFFLVWKCLSFVQQIYSPLTFFISLHCGLMHSWHWNWGWFLAKCKDFSTFCLLFGCHAMNIGFCSSGRKNDNFTVGFIMHDVVTNITK